jgi:hypothetical protein
MFYDLSHEFSNKSKTLHMILMIFFMHLQKQQSHFNGFIETHNWKVLMQLAFQTSKPSINARSTMTGYSSVWTLFPISHQRRAITDRETFSDSSLRQLSQCSTSQQLLTLL